MKTALRNLLAVVAGLALGSLLNGALVTAGPHVIAPPAGVNMADADSLAASVHLLAPRHFLFPFLAHAVGTLAGSWLTCLLAVSARTPLGYAIGVVYLAGGVVAALLINAPVWFLVLDLMAAYLPMAWLGVRLAYRLRPVAPAKIPRV